nr:MAG TPA: hypothetical protein [Bacteriophage sp.]
MRTIKTILAPRQKRVLKKDHWRGWGCDRTPGEPLLSPPNIFKIKKALSATYKYIKYKSTHDTIYT